SGDIVRFFFLREPILQIFQRIIGLAEDDQREETLETIHDQVLQFGGGNRDGLLRSHGETDTTINLQWIRKVAVPGDWVDWLNLSVWQDIEPIVAADEQKLRIIDQIFQHDGQRVF